MAEQDEAFLTLGVVRVLNDSTQWITEHGDGFIEGDPVFHLACSVTRGRAPEQCPKIQTGAASPGSSVTSKPVWTGQNFRKGSGQNFRNPQCLADILELRIVRQRLQLP